MAPGRRMVYPLLERPLIMRHALGATTETHPFAQVVPSLAADATLAAGDADLERDTVPDIEPHCPGTNSHHDAG